jgi:hypothetical protein
VTTEFDNKTKKFLLQYSESNGVMFERINKKEETKDR